MTKATIDTRFNPKFWTQEKPPEILVQQAKEQVLASFLEHAPPWEYIRVPRDVDHLDDLFEAASHIQSPEMAMLRVLKITAEQVDPRFYFGIPLEVQSFPTLFGPENQRGLTFAAGILEGGNSVEVFERKNLKGGLIAERYGFYSCVRLPHEVAPRVGFSHHYVSDVRAQLRKRQAFPTFEKLTQDDVWEILLYHLDPEASFVKCGKEFISSLDDRKKAVSNYCEAHDFSESDIIRTLPILKRLGIHLQGEQILDRSILVSNTLFEDNA